MHSEPSRRWAVLFLPQMECQGSAFPFSEKLSDGGRICHQMAFGLAYSAICLPLPGRPRAHSSPWHLNLHLHTQPLPGLLPLGPHCSGKDAAAPNGHPLPTKLVSVSTGPSSLVLLEASLCPLLSLWLCCCNDRYLKMVL